MNNGPPAVAPSAASANTVAADAPNEYSPLISSVNVGNVNVNVDRLATAATELLDAADKHVPTLGRNGRRKFFHALAVIMMLPGVAFDVRLFCFQYTLRRNGLRVLGSFCCFATAGIPTFIAQCCICLIRVRGIREIFRAVSVWCSCPSVLERIPGS